MSNRAKTIDLIEFLHVACVVIQRMVPCHTNSGRYFPSFRRDTVSFTYGIREQLYTLKGYCVVTGSRQTFLEQNDTFVLENNVVLFLNLGKD